MGPTPGARVLMVHPSFDSPSGGDTVAAWLLHGLCARYAVTLLTWAPPDAAAIDRYYGTSISEARFEVRTVGPVARTLYRLDRDPWRFQSRCYLLRVCHRICHEYDAVISADNELDSGSPGIQYVHYPGMERFHTAEFLNHEAPWYRKALGALRGRYRPWMHVSEHSFERIKRNVTIVNSDWTGRWVNRVYGIATRTIFPPVPGDFPSVRWEDRANSFVCIGRFCRYKRFNRVIEILGLVRRRFPDLRLHVIGSPSKNGEEDSYVHGELAALFAANASWVHVHDTVPRDELVRIVTGQRYGIHAAYAEHFGIAPAELVRGGCITFVPDSGGQVEIVDEDPQLIYTSVADAVDKIVRVMGAADLQISLRRALDQRRGLFGTERFMAEMCATLDEFLGQRAANPPA